MLKLLRPSWIILGHLGSCRIILGHLSHPHILSLNLDYCQLSREESDSSIGDLVTHSLTHFDFGTYDKPLVVRELCTQDTRIQRSLFTKKSGLMRQSNHPPPLHPPKVGWLLSHFDKYKSLYSRNMIEH